MPDFAVVRANGAPLYTLVNPVDDALMGITHVLRGEDLLSSTPRQIALYRALYAIGVAEYMPEFGHLPYVMGQGNKKLSKRDPESSLFLHRERGFIREGLLNYLSLLGWSLSADEDIFTVEQLVANFDIHDVLGNPARFDIKKAEAINGTHVRMLTPEDFRQRLVPYLRAAGFVGEILTPRQEEILAESAPLVQERITLLGEAPEMLAFLFKKDDAIDIADDARKGLPENLVEVLDAALVALEPSPTGQRKASRQRSSKRWWKILGSSRASRSARCARQSPAAASRRRCSNRWSSWARIPRSPACARSAASSGTP
ncbi:glutamate--tRNA ligase [Arthrobacter sp. Hiyo8]|nr:glutamate--tRNA ligase [Arthrobacter sp. Hiyo8]